MPWRYSKQRPLGTGSDTLELTNLGSVCYALAFTLVSLPMPDRITNLSLVHNIGGRSILPMRNARANFILLHKVVQRQDSKEHH